MIRIFVSSTFMDMHEERDMLESIERNLNIRLERYGEKIEFVDLRWGISTDETSGNENTRVVLEGCFSCIDSSEMFLVFLGNRVGTQKDYSELKAVLGELEAKKLTENFSKEMSITELEIAYAHTKGVMHNNNVIVCKRREGKTFYSPHRIVDFFEGKKEYGNVLKEYSADNKRPLKKFIEDKILQYCREKLNDSTRMEKDRRKIIDISEASIQNSRISNWKIDTQIVVISDEEQIGKTSVACNLIKNNMKEEDICFAYFGERQRFCSYMSIKSQLLKAIKERLGVEEISIEDEEEFIANGIQKLQSKGSRLFILLDSLDDYHDVDFQELLRLVGKQTVLMLTSKNKEEVLNKLFNLKITLIDREDIFFDDVEVENILRNSFQNHRKEIPREALEILCKKADIKNPIYLHMAIRRMIFLKETDYKRIRINGESIEQGVVKISAELPGRIRDMVVYMMKYVCDNFRNKEMAYDFVSVFGVAHGAIDKSVLCQYLKECGKYQESKNQINMCVTELMYYLENFLWYEQDMIHYRFDQSLYLLNDLNYVKRWRNYICRHKDEIANECIVREYIRLNEQFPKRIIAFASKRKLWKESVEIRDVYRREIWNLNNLESITAYLYEFVNRLENEREHCINKVNFVRLLTEKIDYELTKEASVDHLFVLLYLFVILKLDVEISYKNGEVISLDFIAKGFYENIEKLAVILNRFVIWGQKTSENASMIQGIYYHIQEYMKFLTTLCTARHESGIDSEDIKVIKFYYSAAQILTAQAMMEKRTKPLDNSAHGNFYLNWNLKHPIVFKNVRMACVTWLLERRFNVHPEIISDVVSYYCSYFQRKTVTMSKDDMWLLMLIGVSCVDFLNRNKGSTKDNDKIKEQLAIILRCSKNILEQNIRMGLISIRERYELFLLAKVYDEIMELSCEYVEQIEEDLIEIFMLCDIEKIWAEFPEYIDEVIASKDIDTTRRMLTLKKINDIFARLV